MKPDVDTPSRLQDDARSIWSSFRGKHVLLLQGPMGPFFTRVAERLRRNGATVSKVNLNAADAFYYSARSNVHLYRGDLRHWPEYLNKLASRCAVTTVMLFGDCRPYHRAAIDCARELGIEVYVFEEGYLRPNFITLERDGVNGNSKLPRDPAFYQLVEPQPFVPPLPVSNTYAWGVFHSMVYTAIASFFWWLTPRYTHHRNLNWFRQGLLWVRGGARRLLHAFRDRKFAYLLENGPNFPFFFVPLQVHLDSQLSHSDFRDITEFIETIVRSFANHAPKDTCLVLKDHPLDRAYRNYSSQLSKLRRQYSLGKRLQYVDIVNLPAALRHARGTVVINSTVGLSSLIHHTPTLCLGRAVYDMAGLTHQGPLNEFWQQPGSVDPILLQKFIRYLRRETQLEGSVWTGFVS